MFVSDYWLCIVYFALVSVASRLITAVCQFGIVIVFENS